ncbi:Retrovirus-related Pol polyprotein from transposon TNT 1-94 [Eumeta japonica]|uniref:Retrovirus-related Pol polyprotein from transposon TNT 1-94 n=1 Tax=Eumeta variegata TaxID=151549 RepID=A0A4C1X6I2_EUMVA|nr:Retrovirus-related Pol polyprotein from transposon TNT 1-94 [Eumeta japonica]
MVEKARCLFDAGLPKRFWAEAVNTAVYLRNRSIALGLINKTPVEIWTGAKTDVSSLRIFGRKRRRGDMKHITTLEDQEQNKSESSDIRRTLRTPRKELWGLNQQSLGEITYLSQGFPLSFQWSSQLRVFADNLISILLDKHVVVKTVTLGRAGPVMCDDYIDNKSKLVCNFSHEIRRQLNKFWELEEVSSRPKMSEEEEACEQTLYATHADCQMGDFVLRSL